MDPRVARLVALALSSLVLAARLLGGVGAAREMLPVMGRLQRAAARLQRLRQDQAGEEHHG